MPEEEKDDCVNWSALPTDLWGYTSKFVGMIEDFMAFRGVCTSWRATTTKDKFAGVSKVPLLMLAEKEGGSSERELYSLSHGKIWKSMPLPDAMGKRCIDVGFGWIMTLAPSGDVCLLKPFSGATIKLPNITTFPEYAKHNFFAPIYSIRKAVLTANPSETSDFTVFMNMARAVGFWRNGDVKWESKGLSSRLITYFKGKLHILDFKGMLWIWDPQGDLTQKVKVDNVPITHISYMSHYLVGSTTGELLLIERNNTGLETYAATGVDHFRVMRLDLEKEECIEINDLGKDAIFVGDNVATSVDATEFRGVLRPNCIYFTDDCVFAYLYTKYGWDKGGGKDMGIYNVQDRSIERFNVESSFSRVCPPLWIFPSL